MNSALLGLADDTFNQPPPLTDYNLFCSDQSLRRTLRRENAPVDEDGLTAFGAVAGSAGTAELARLANQELPQLKQFSDSGERVDRVEFHPAWHSLMSISARQGLHHGAWPDFRPDLPDGKGANVTRAAAFYMAAQMESGHTCPITMTNAVVATLKQQPDVAEPWLSKIAVADYDGAFAPIEQKRAATIGMGMTEKQGGTDVRTNTTQAIPVDGEGPGREYLLTGHKWFLSAPMCDAFLVLAQAPGGLSCFLLPRFLPDGTQNRILIQRLKDKIGNRSNASSEVEFERTHAWMVGEEGRGIATIINMVTYTRLDCAIASAAMMRQSFANVVHHVSHRVVFQKKLIDHALMRQVVADMALDQEAASALVFRLARAFDGAADDPREAAFARIMAPVAKFWVCKMLPGFACEAVECLGGNGYVEDGPMARLYREAPLNAIWEGSGNVMCLDVLRAVNKDREGFALLFDGLIECANGEARLANSVEKLRNRFANPSGLEADMRYVVERMAQTVAACLMVKDAPEALSDAFICSRVRGGFRHNYGSLRGADVSTIIEATRPIL